MVGIYKITNPKGKSYIGQSIDIESRHIQYKNGHCKQQPKLYNSIQKYGWDNHEVEIIVECGVTELDNLEIYYIEKFNTLTNGLNLSGGGEGGGLKTELTKQKISKSHKGMKKSWVKSRLTQEAREKAWETKRNQLNPIYQYDLDGNFIKKWNKPSHASKTLNLNRGWLSVVTDDFTQTLGGYMWSSKHYENLPPTTKHQSKKKQVLQYDLNGNLIKEWNSAKDAANSVGIAVQCITAVCRGVNKTSKGFIWKYK